MNISVRLTLDGMVRALRWKLHALAEEAAAGDHADAARDLPRSDRAAARREEGADDRAGE